MESSKRHTAVQARDEVHQGRWRLRFIWRRQCDADRNPRALAPGHQCLLVRLPKTGAVLLTGDAVHTRPNWDSHRVPERNFNVSQSLAALDRMAMVLKEHKAQLWIGHEPSEVPLRKYAPAYYD